MKQTEKHISDDKKICTIFNNFFSNVVSDLAILTGKKLCYTQFNIRMAEWRLLTFFICLQNHILKVQMFGKYDSSNRQ